MKDVGFGIIGIGRQGLRLSEHIRKDIKHGKLIAVCRRSKEGHDYSTEHGLKFYSDHHDLLADKEVNAVIIATPSGLHGVQALDALNAKKHLLIDKPIASSIKEAEDILSHSKKEGLTVAVNFPLRVNAVTLTLKKNLKKIGKLKKIQVLVSHGPLRSEWQSNTKLSNGGVILDLGSHYLDLLSFLTGCRPEAINNAYSEEAENENSGFIDLRYKDFDASIVLLRNQKFRKNVITFAGDKGFLFADYSGKEVVLSTDHEIEEIKCPAANDFEIILNNLVNSINKKEEPVADAEAGLHSLEAVLAVYKAIRSREPVQL